MFIFLHKLWNRPKCIIYFIWTVRQTSSKRKLLINKNKHDITNYYWKYFIKLKNLEKITKYRDKGFLIKYFSHSVMSDYCGAVWSRERYRRQIIAQRALFFVHCSRKRTFTVYLPDRTGSVKLLPRQTE